MHSVRPKLLVLVIYYTLFGPYPLRCQTPQTVDVSGKVVEAVKQTAIDGVDVVLRSSTGGLLAKVVTGSDGKYKASGLKVGDSVTIYYQRGGYLPRPAGPVTIVLVIGTNVKNLQLMLDKSKDAAYWPRWAGQAKYDVDAYTTDPARRNELYVERWNLLGASGFDSVSQALAARQILEVTPEANHSLQLMSFASVNLDTLQLADPNIRAAVDGQGELSDKYPIPPDVATAIAADELKKRGFIAPPPDFMKSFGAVWGDSATRQLTQALSTSPTKEEIAKKWDDAGTMSLGHSGLDRPIPQ